MNSVILNDIHDIIRTAGCDEYLTGKTILVTGATGHIAKYFSYYLLELNRARSAGMKILLLARNMQKLEAAFGGYLQDDGVEVLLQDVCDEIRYEGHTDYILHAAGAASAAAIRSNPLGIIKANTAGTLNVIEFAKRSGCSRILFTSTREIYGEVSGTDCISETDMGVLDPLNSRNCYPESKRLAEAMLESGYIQYGVGFNVLRIAHTYGPAMNIVNDGRVMADFMDCAVHSRDIVLNSDGTAVRGFCYVADTLRGMLDVLTKGEPCRAYNLANETEPAMIRDVAAMLLRVNGDGSLKVSYKEADEATKKGYLGYRIVRLDTAAIEALGWVPRVTLEEGLGKTLEYFREEEAHGRS